MIKVTKTHKSKAGRKSNFLALVAVAFLMLIGFAPSAQANSCLLGPERIIDEFSTTLTAGLRCDVSRYGPACPVGSNTGDLVTLPSTTPPANLCVTRFSETGVRGVSSTCRIRGRDCVGGAGGGRYSWEIGAWIDGPCTGSNQQAQTRNVTCRDVVTNNVESDILCPAPKPATSQTITRSCGGGGAVGVCGGTFEYEDCVEWPAPSTPEIIFRTLNCAPNERISCNTKSCRGWLVADIFAQTCSCVADATCAPPPLTYSWEVGAWSNGTCTPPDQQTQTRTVTCRDSAGNAAANANCPAPAPATSRVVTSSCLSPPGANACTSNPAGLAPANRFDVNYRGKECAASGADRARVLGTDIVIGGYGGAQPIDFCNAMNATCCEMERMPSPTPCTGRGCVVFQVTAFGPGNYTVQNITSPGRGVNGDVYATCAGGTPTPGAPFEACVCENHCNGLWTWNGAQWFSTDALGNDPDDTPNCRPAPKPQRALGSSDTGAVEYFNGQVTARITPFVNPVGQSDWFYFPNDHLGADGSYCVGGACTPIRYCRNGRDIQLRADCQETDLGVCATCSPGTFCQGGDRMNRAANCAVSVLQPNDPTCQTGACSISQTCSGPNLVQINSDCSSTNLGPDPSCQPSNSLRECRNSCGELLGEGDLWCQRGRSPRRCVNGLWVSVPDSAAACSGQSGACQ